MILSEHEKRIESIWKHYGTEHQLVKLVEECAELTQAALKYREAMRGDEYDRNVAKSNLWSEMADVLVMIEQAAAATGMKRQNLLYIVEYKTARQEGRIRQEEREHGTDV